MPARATDRYGNDSFVIATGNPGKRREFEVLLEDFLAPEWKIWGRNDFPEPLDEVEETAQTFRENALKKAMETATATGCCSLADDSGLEVDALDGAPGIRSARFAGDDATDEENNELLLSKLADVPEEKRTARFVAVIALALPDNQIARTILARRGLTLDEVAPAAPRTEGQPVRIGDRVVIWFRGTVEGIVATEAQGDQGFGYDPHFHIPNQDLRMAELSTEQKNQISHRANATRKLVDFFS